MIDNSSLAYPADYYYPEFIYSRPDEPPTSPPLHLPLTSVDNGIGSTSRVPTAVQQVNETRVKQPVAKQQSSTRLAVDVATNQGLPDHGMTETVRTDPKTNLLRDPAERNLAKLIVDDSVIQQSVRTSKSSAITLGNDYEQTNRYNQFNNRPPSLANGYTNGDLTNRTQLYEPGRQQYEPGRQQYESGRPQTTQYIGDEQQSIDDRWKKEVLIDDQGVVHIDVRFD